jgi:hypothetical protein
VKGPVRAIDGLPIIGQPSYWTGIPDGYLTKWPESSAGASPPPSTAAPSRPRSSGHGEGHYSLTVTAAGWLNVVATTAEPFFDMEEQRMIPGDVRAVAIRLDGSGQYEAPPLAIRQCPD